MRSIVLGKQNRPVEFDAKASLSAADTGLARVDHLSWETFHEGKDLTAHAEASRGHHGLYHAMMLADASRESRGYLKQCGIRFAGKPAWATDRVESLTIPPTHPR